jgi:hypothetical protein
MASVTEMILVVAEGVDMDKLLTTEEASGEGADDEEAETNDATELLSRNDNVISGELGIDEGELNGIMDDRGEEVELDVTEEDSRAVSHLP